MARLFAKYATSEEANLGKNTNLTSSTPQSGIYTPPILSKKWNIVTTVPNDLVVIGTHYHSMVQLPPAKIGMTVSVTTTHPSNPLRVVSDPADSILTATRGADPNLAFNVLLNPFDAKCFVCVRDGVWREIAW
jgi:hypothetical protein